MESSEHRENKSEKRVAVGKAVERLRGVWPWREAESEEVVRVLMGRQDKWEVEDLRAGVDALISQWGSQANAWPKPYDVAGFVMKAVRDRTGGEEVRRAENYYRRGMTFSEWWATVPESEKPRHEAIRRMFAKDQTEGEQGPGEIEW